MNLRWSRVAKVSLLYLGAMLAFVYLTGPFVWLVSSSLQTETALLSVPPKWIPNPVSLESYAGLLRGALTGETAGTAYQVRIFPRSLLNSLIVAASVAVAAVAAGAYAAYPLARLRFRGKNAVMFLILGTRMMPALAIAVPFYLAARFVGMLNRLETLVIINLSFILPYVIWLLRAYFQSIPEDLEDAGRMDGCTRGQVVRLIILPLSLPGLVAAGILAFMLTWGEFFFALILTSSEAAYTSTVVAAMFATDVDIDYVAMIAAGVLSVIPPVLVALTFQKYIVSGLLAGSVKG
ncbi:carbohydrate ABC transporter permease [Limnochorda pilosa]|uniref:Sugar ABC transporter permease n=1 Tax=Limnochorda pilosa TaxID=1555112 RepID=A0A0K2SLQ3_LIMPI|nr:carbohydrate ABC transporter permease [Limnochorda pilosa]BAS28056.1 sugar ABC transporter permease [Limnochorda pilosa]